MPDTAALLPTIRIVYSEYVKRAVLRTNQTCFFFFFFFLHIFILQPLEDSAATVKPVVELLVVHSQLAVA